MRRFLSTFNVRHEYIILFEKKESDECAKGESTYIAFASIDLDRILNCANINNKYYCNGFKIRNKYVCL